MEFAPTDPRTLFLAGTINASRGLLEPAAICYSRGLGRTWSGHAGRDEVLALHDELKEALGGKGLRLDKPFAERFVESDAGDWQKLESPRFEAHHHNAKLAALVLQSAEHYLDRVLANMSLPGPAPWEGKCPIYIYRDAADYRKACGQAEWSGGVSSVKSRGGALVSQRISTYQTAPKLLNSVLPHELAHLVHMSATGYSKAVPLALHEGVAVYNELAFRRSYYAGVLRTHLGTESTMSMAKLLAATDYPEKPDLFYAQSLSLVTYLVGLRGAPAFRGFSQAVGKSGPAAALDEHYGFKTFDELEQAWLSWARGQAK